MSSSQNYLTAGSSTHASFSGPKQLQGAAASQRVGKPRADASRRLHPSTAHCAYATREEMNLKQTLSAPIPPVCERTLKLTRANTPTALVRKPHRRFFPKAAQHTSARPKGPIATLSRAAIDSTTRKGIGTAVARRRFQRGTVYLNKTKTLWIGAYSQYSLDAHGVERRKRVRIVLSPSRKDDGTPVRKNEAKSLLQPLHQPRE